MAAGSSQQAAVAAQLLVTDPAPLFATDSDPASINDELLIDLVRSYKIIWFTGGRGYKDTQKKNLAWKEIATKMGNVDGKKCLLSNVCEFKTVKNLFFQCVHCRFLDLIA